MIKDEEIIFIHKDKLIPQNYQMYNDADTTIAIMKEYKCLIMENVTKLVTNEEYNLIKSV
jgi:hypothetical protein